MKTIQILISTINSRVKNVEDILLDKRDDLSYIIICQYTTPDPPKIPIVLEDRGDVTIIFSKGKGLTKSRNIALKNISADIGIIADDDVRYTNESIDIIKNTHTQNPEVSIALFKIDTKEDREYKNYAKNEVIFSLNKFPHWPSSIEITFKRKDIQNKIWFDERFGLGTKFPGGEEKLFILDALKQSKIVKYFPYNIVHHPYESSGKKISGKFNKKRLMINSAIDAREKGGISIYWVLLFTYSLIKVERVPYKHAIDYFLIKLYASLVILLTKKTFY